MENLNEIPPQKLRFDDPFKAPMSSQKIVSVKPTSGQSITGASSSDSITFKLPSAGVLDCASMYVKYTVTPSVTAGSSGGIACVGVVADEFSPDSSIFQRMKVFSSDGTQVSDTAHYNTYCSVMNRLKKTKEEAESRGSIVCGNGVAEGEALSDTGALFADAFNYTNATRAEDAAITATDLLIRKQEGCERNARLLSQFNVGQQGAGGVRTGAESTVCHKIQSGLLDNETGHLLPTFAMGSGYQLTLDLAAPNVAFRAVGSNAEGKLGAIDAVHTDAVISYNVTNVELVCSLNFYDSSIFSSINQLLCDGIKLAHPRVKTQENAISSQSGNYQLAEHGRSINYLVAGMRKSANLGKHNETENDFVWRNSGAWLSKFQCQVGTQIIPSQSVVYGAQSFLELERAIDGSGEGKMIGNQVSAPNYWKNESQGEKVSGSALFGVNFRSQPQQKGVLSGLSSSSGSIPLSLQLELNVAPDVASSLFTIVGASQVTELLHDGSCVISR